MAISMGAALLGSTAIGTVSSIIGGNKAAKATTKAAQTASDTERYFYDTTRADEAPWREAGGRGVTRVADLYGLNGADARAAASRDFETSPGYQFRVDQALKAVERTASARGRLRSPATEKAVGRYISDYVAGPEFQSYGDRLAQIAGVGQSATNSTAAAGAQAASGISNAQMAAGNARASGYVNTANAVNQGVQNVASYYLYNQGYNNNGGSGVLKKATM